MVTATSCVLIQLSFIAACVLLRNWSFSWERAVPQVQLSCGPLVAPGGTPRPDGDLSVEARTSPNNPQHLCESRCCCIFPHGQRSAFNMVYGVLSSLHTEWYGTNASLWHITLNHGTTKWLVSLTTTLGRVGGTLNIWLLVDQPAIGFIGFQASCAVVRVGA